MSEQSQPNPSPLAAKESDEEKVASQKEFEARMQEQRNAQNLSDPNAVPEQRPIASQVVDDPHSQVYKDLQEAGDPRANNEPMDLDAYKRAQSPEQAKKAAKQSREVTRLYPGARAYIENPGQPDHGRAVAVNAVHSWADPQSELLAASGTVEGRFAAPAEYECMSRDGRAELMIVSAEHLRVPSNQADWGKTPIS